MKTFTGTEISPDIRQILSDTDAGDYTFEDAELVVNINAAIRALFGDAPVASYTSPVSFQDAGDVEISLLADTINIDIRYKDALIHYTAARCYYQNRRDTANIERGDDEMKRYRGALR